MVDLEEPPPKPKKYKFIQKILPVLIVGWLVLATCEQTSSSWMSGGTACGCKGYSVRLNLPGMEGARYFLCLGIPR